MVRVWHAGGVCCVSDGLLGLVCGGGGGVGEVRWGARRHGRGLNANAPFEELQTGDGALLLVHGPNLLLLGQVVHFDAFVRTARCQRRARDSKRSDASNM